MNMITATETTNPFLMKGMAEAVKRIRQSVSGKEKIMVFADADIDGITSAVILINFLSMLDCDVVPFLSNRHIDGFGLNTNTNVISNLT